jgi:hypothetical protein
LKVARGNSARLVVVWDNQNEKRAVEEARGLQKEVGRDSGFRFASMRIISSEPKAEEGWKMAEGAWNEGVGGKKVKMYFREENGIIRFGFYLVSDNYLDTSDIADLLQEALQEGKILEGLELGGKRIEQIVIVDGVEENIESLKAEIRKVAGLAVPATIQSPVYQALLEAA